jgi:hypothetical protein
VWSSAPLESVETAIRFLEADLDCFRSNYIKERLIRHLVRQDLGDEALRRLRRVVLSALEGPVRASSPRSAASPSASRTTRLGQKSTAFPGTKIPR